MTSNSVFANKNFLLLWLARLISRLGDWLLDVALPVLVYNLTGSAIALGSIVAIEVLPTIFLAPFAGVIADKVERQKVLTFTNICLGLSVLLLLLVRDANYLPIIYLVAIINSCFGTLLMPAQSALLPELVTDSQLTQANSVMALTLQSTRFVGPMVAGVALAITTPDILFVLDAFSFLLAALLVSQISKFNVELSQEKVVPRVRKTTAFFRDVREGFSVIWHSRILQVVISFGTVMMLSAGVVMTALLIFVTDILGGTDSAYGYMLSAQGAGMILGGVLMMVVLKRWSPALLFTVFTAVFALTFLGVSWSTGLVWGVIGVGAMGLCMAIITICTQTMMQETVANEFRGRVFATTDAMTSVAMLLGASVGGILTELIGARSVLITAALISCGAALIPIITNLPRLQQSVRNELKKAENSMLG